MSSIIRADRWQDSNGVAYNSVLQVVQTVKTDTFTTASTSYVDVTGLSVSITPKFVTSKVLVIATVAVSNAAAGEATHVGLVRDSTQIGLGESSGSRPRSSFFSYTPSGTDNNRVIENGTIYFLDSPATTSATTYKIQIRAGGNTATLNRSGQDPDSGNAGRPISTITVMEIAQ